MKLPGSALPASEDRRLRRRLKKVRRTCEALLAEWGMERGCGIDELHGYLSEQRRRPIHLISTPFPERHLFGIWLKLDDFDVIAFEAAASASHKEHIIAHELAHIALEHSGSVQLDRTDPSTLFSDVDPETVRSVLMRSRYSDDEEQEAETMASLILARAAKRWTEPAWGVPAEAAEIVARIESGIGRSERPEQGPA
ncbi:toxin [Streptomyces sp. NBC_00249]|uniref:toxin n=1 Tax=Streptomyces sp. NBC_00249 TaxID=2975690 RepID=UPI0022517843|nr:toxin [Streptomyces sp. NBC_00249]MCX5193502.1 toxin [Streptomyces sp. NBC_00249]